MLKAGWEPERTQAPAVRTVWVSAEYLQSINRILAEYRQIVTVHVRIHEYELLVILLQLKPVWAPIHMRVVRPLPSNHSEKFQSKIGRLFRVRKCVDVSSVYKDRLHV